MELELITEDDTELARSQWMGVTEIINLIPAAAEITRKDTLRALKLRGLATVRPAILDVSENPRQLTSSEDEHARSSIEKILTPKTDWLPSDTDDPSVATVEFHKPALMKWLRKTDLKVEDNTLREWESDTLPKLRKRGLLVESNEEQAIDRNEKRTAVKESLIVQLSEAPDFVGVGRSTFDSEIRPYLRTIMLGKRGVYFLANELTEFVNNYASSNAMEPESKWPTDSNNEVKSGTSTKPSMGDGLDEAVGQSRRKKQNGS